MSRIRILRGSPQIMMIIVELHPNLLQYYSEWRGASQFIKIFQLGSLSGPQICITLYGRPLITFDWGVILSRVQRI